MKTKDKHVIEEQIELLEYLIWFMERMKWSLKRELKEQL